MSHVLLITSSPRAAESISTRFATQIAEGLKARLGGTLTVRDLATENFGPSSQLKAWLDHITWPGVTFSYADGMPTGLLTGKKTYLVTAAGGVFSEGANAPFDFQTNYLLHLLGFIGLTDVELVRIEGTMMGPDAANAAMADTEMAVQSLLAKAA